MKKSKTLLILLILVNLIFLRQAFAGSLKIEEEDTSPSSIFLYQKNDSLLSAKYDSIKRIYEKGEYVEGLSLALEFYEFTKNKSKKFEFLAGFLVGDIFDKTNNFDKSLDYYKRALRIVELSMVDGNDEFSRVSNSSYARNLLRIGAAFQKLKNNDSAMYYYKRLEGLNSLNNDILSYKATSFSNLSGIFMKEKKYEVAKGYAEKAVEMHRKRSQNVDVAGALGNLSSVYLLEKDYKTAKKINLEALDLIDKDNGAKSVRYKASIYANLAYCMYKLQDYKAYEYQGYSFDIKNDLRDIEMRRIVEQINATHNVDTVKQQEQLKLLKQKEKTWGVTVLSISILIVLIGTVAYFKFRQKNMSLKLSRNELIQQQKIEKLKSESQIRILNATIDGKESERKQIAETLHDSVSTLLSSANLHLQACRSQFNGSTPVEIEKSQKIITEASDKIRDLSHTLVSSVLLKFGLQYSLKDMADKYSNSQIEIRTDISDLRRYDQSFEIKTYNIIQEFINNILKHSKATKAELTLFEKDQKLILAINDNGQGFDKNLIPEKDGLGINQIDARIKMMQGKFTIESSKGNGTKIEVELPIHEREAVTLA